MTTISSLLEQTLDLIDDNIPTKNVQSNSTISASQQLLNNRKKLQRTINNEDFIHFESTSNQIPVNPYLDQISSSSVDDPKYWKTNNQKKISTSSVVYKSSIPSMKNQVNGRTNQNKAKALRKVKGQDYKEKFTAKLLNINEKNAKRKQFKSD